MESANESLIRAYEQDVANLAHSDGLGTEEEIVVVTREAVSQRTWSSAEWARIEQADARLVARWRQFEDILPNPNFADRSHWWWFLNEGPQVREQAKHLDTEPAQA